jgi:serine/threonine protein kinase
MALADLILKEPHPNLVSIIKKTTFAGNPALVLKAYDGDFSSLKGRMTLQQKRAALSQVAQGLIYLHKHGVVHHDIKPVNILVNIIDSENVEAVICDFESISIPGARYQPEHHWSELSWGPFAQQDGTKLSQDDRWLCKKWSPTKYTQAFITKNHEEANPWRLDLSSVGIILVKTLIDESWDEQMIIRDESVRFLFDEKVTSVDEAVRDLGTAAHLLTKKGE